MDSFWALSSNWFTSFFKKFLQTFTLTFLWEFLLGRIPKVLKECHRELMMESRDGEIGRINLEEAGNITIAIPKQLRGEPNSSSGGPSKQILVELLIKIPMEHLKHIWRNSWWIFQGAISIWISVKSWDEMCSYFSSSSWHYVPTCYMFYEHIHSYYLRAYSVNEHFACVYHVVGTMISTLILH